MKFSVAVSFLFDRGAKTTLQMGVKKALRKFGYDIVKYKEDRNLEQLDPLSLAIKRGGPICLDS